LIDINLMSCSWWGYLWSGSYKSSFLHPDNCWSIRG